MLPSEMPSARYYASMCGAWSGAYRFAITDRGAMRAALAGRFDRFVFALFHRLRRSTMSTSVRFLSETEVLHTTRVSVWGLPGLFSRERFRLAPDGHRFTVHMTQRRPPAVWRRREFPEGNGIVLDPAVGADYRFPWIGCEIVQQARIVDGGVEITQVSPWFRGEVLLKKR